MDDVAMIMEREAGMPEHVNPVGVGFCLYPLEDKEASENEGRPIFKDVEFVKIQVPGDRDSIVFQPATAKHKERFPRAYQAFLTQTAVALQGTPVEHWPVVTRATAWTLKAAGISTVEALAEVHDGNLEKLGTNARELRAKARAFIDQAASTAAAQKLAREKQELLDLIGDLQAQIGELAKAQGVDVPDVPKRKPAAAKKAAKKAA